MATRMWLAAYAGAARAPGRLRLCAAGAAGASACAVLNAIDDAGRLHQIEPALAGEAEWALAVGAGPILIFQTLAGPLTIGPTRGAEFHLALVAATADPAQPVIVSLSRDGEPLRAVGPSDNGGVVADSLEEAPGRTLDVSLEA